MLFITHQLPKALEVDDVLRFGEAEGACQRAKIMEPCQPAKADRAPFNIHAPYRKT